MNRTRTYRILFSLQKEKMIRSCLNGRATVCANLEKFSLLIWVIMTKCIHGLILVERDSQKKIVIGKQGQRLKLIGTEARKDIEALFYKKVNLKLWVKVRKGWSDDDRALRSLGYHDE